MRQVDDTMRIVLAEENRMVREGLRSLLNQQPGIAVIGEAADGHHAVQLTLELAPDVVIMEVDMPYLNGIEAARQISAAKSSAKIIALTMQGDKHLIAEMLKVGATGYLLKDSAFEDLVTAVHAVTANQSYLSPHIATVVIEHYVRHPNHQTTVFDDLSTRERQVLQQVAEGRTTKQIAHRLRLKSKTVEFHRHQVMKKLDLHSVAELTKYAIRAGITTLHG